MSLSSTPNPPAIVLLSGGLDSATVLAIARERGHACHCIAFDYGQRHRGELQAAERIATEMLAASFRIVPLGLREIGGSALTDDIPVPDHTDRNDDDAPPPVTYVPGRNLIFLSVAAGLAEVVRAEVVFAGMNSIDYSGYPDCRPDFLESFESAANLATAAGRRGHGIRIDAPLISMTKADIIRAGTKLGVPYAWTRSCYAPSDEGQACGRCDSCVLRARGFADAGVDDPTHYVTPPALTEGTR